MNIKIVKATNEDVKKADELTTKSSLIFESYCLWS